MPTPNPMIPPGARIQVELMKLGRTRMGLRIPVQEGYPRGFFLEAESPRTGARYKLSLVDCLQLDGYTLYMKGQTQFQPSLSTYAYASSTARDEAYTMFLQLLTQANQGVDPRVEAVTIQPPVYVDATQPRGL